MIRNGVYKEKTGQEPKKTTDSSFCDTKEVLSGKTIRDDWLFSSVNEDVFEPFRAWILATRTIFVIWIS